MTWRAIRQAFGETCLCSSLPIRSRRAHESCCEEDNVRVSRFASRECNRIPWSFKHLVCRITVRRPEGRDMRFPDLGEPPEEPGAIAMSCGHDRDERRL